MLIFLEAGYNGIVLTADGPYLGKRLNEYRNSFAMPKGMVFPNFGPGFTFDNMEATHNERLDYANGIEWGEAIAFLRKYTKLPIWIKGSRYSPVPFCGDWPADSR